MTFSKRIALPLSAYFNARIYDPKAGYGGNIPANGYVNLGNYGAQYDQKTETLFIVFDAERDDQPLTPLSLPEAVAGAERVEHNDPARGQVRTPYPRTRPLKDSLAPTVAVPDMAEGVTPKEAEFAPGTTPSRNEYFTLVVLPDETNVTLFDYKEPLTTFLRDAHRFSVYLEARTAPIGQVIPGTLDAADHDLMPKTIVQPEPSDAAKAMVAAFEKKMGGIHLTPSAAPEVHHLGATGNLFKQRFSLGLERLFAEVAAGHGFGHSTYGGRIPLRGYRVDGKPTVSFDANTGKLNIEFKAERTVEPLTGFKNSVEEPVPDIADGLTAADAEFAPGTAPIAYHELAVYIAQDYGKDGRCYATAFSAPHRKPVLKFTENGVEYSVLLEVQTRSYENDLYDHEVRFSFEEIEEYSDGHMLWTSGHKPDFVKYEDIDPSTVSVRLSSNRKKIVANVKLRRDGDFDYIKEDIKSQSISQVKTGSVEARDHGEEPTYGFDGNFGPAEFIEVTDIGFRFHKLKDGEAVPTVKELEESEFLDGWGNVYVGTAGDYAVYAFYHED